MTPAQENADNFWHTRYYAPLDGLRALSLLLVVAAHCHTNLPIKRFFSGGLGVGIFFVLSGFLITLLLLREELATGKVSFGAFYIRRAFRILPAYLLTLAVYLLLGLLPSQHDLNVKFLNGLPYFLTLRNEYVPRGLAVSFTHSWSLSVEEKFYLIWPLLFFLLLPRLRSRWALVPITLAPLCISTTQSLPAAYFALLLGCCLAVALHALRAQQHTVLASIHRIPVWVAALLWGISYAASLQAPFRLAFLLMTTALLPLLLLRRSWLSRLLGSGICTWVGKRTYSMYLLHAICLTFVERLLPPLTVTRFFVVVTASYGLSLAVASLVYALLERPAIRWGRALAARYTEKQILASFAVTGRALRAKETPLGKTTESV